MNIFNPDVISDFHFCRTVFTTFFFSNVRPIARFEPQICKAAKLLNAGIEIAVPKKVKTENKAEVKAPVVEEKV